MTKTELLTYFVYEKSIGELIWKYHWNKSTATQRIGKIAGHDNINHHGYRQVILKGRTLKVHRIVWFLENGKWPTEIDHIDGNRLNNRISNLREVTRRENMQNRRSHREGRLVGTDWCKRVGSWRSRIRIDGIDIHLGQYNTELQAHNAYLRALKELPNAV